VLSCSADANKKRVLQEFVLTASAPGASAASTFRWDLIGTPAGADAAAQLLVNATSSQARFTAVTPSALGVRDYRLRVTLQEPELPAQTCDVTVEAERVPDALQVSLFMNDPLDVDIHLIGGVGSTRFDMPFHELHDPIDFDDDPRRSCHWDNCQVCTVQIPGQGTCVATTPRVVDFSNPRNGASLADPNDPQLDIDNRRGCFTGDNGDLQCIPEKISVENPPPGTYFLWSYLFGNAGAVTPGALTTPTSTTITLEVECRGVRTTFTRTLHSTLSTGGTAPAASSRRYGESQGFVTIEVPTSGACVVTSGG
jgi:hypothetical protein